MNPILLAVIIVSVIGLLLGLVLAIASIVMAVPVDETAVAIEEVLAGANCGACGYSGCAGYASALSKGECTDCTLCAPSGADGAAAIAEILGMEAGSATPMTAVVYCHGTLENSGMFMDYAGVKSCKAASQLYKGGKNCSYGCLGFGDCVNACPFDAIHINDAGIAEVDSLKCKACKICVNTCPKSIIGLVPLYKEQAVVYCSNTDKGAQARKACSTACIGCMKCQKTCTHDAIHVQNFKATVDAEKCVGCGDCVAGCPTHCLEMSTFGQVIYVDAPAATPAE